MPSEPIVRSAVGVDMSSRVVDTTTVAASPSANAETIIATLTNPVFNTLAVVQRVYLQGWCAFTVGTSGTACTLKIRQTNVSGTTIVSTGAVTGGIAATNLVTLDANGSDATPGVGVYVLTLTVTGGAAASTVSAVQLLGYWV